MDEKGAQMFVFVLVNFFSLNIPLLLMSIFDVLTFPIRLIVGTIIPDSVWF